MFDQLIAVIRDHALGPLQAHPNVAENERSDLSGHAASSIVETIQQMAMKGNFSDITDLISGKHSPEESPIAQAATENLTQKLTQEKGMDQGRASSIATVIPGIFRTLMQELNDPNGKQNDFTGLIGQLTGSKLGGVDFKSMLGTFSGKPKD